MRVTEYPKPMSDKETLEFVKYILDLNDCVNIEEFVGVAKTKNTLLKNKLDAAREKIKKLLGEGKTEPVKLNFRKSSPADHYGRRNSYGTPNYTGD